MESPKVEIVGHEEVTGTGKRRHVVYNLSVHVPGYEPYRIQRRYREFFDLKKRIERHTPSCHFPSKKLGTKMALEKLENRKLKLGMWLQSATGYGLEKGCIERQVQVQLVEFLDIAEQCAVDRNTMLWPIGQSSASSERRELKAVIDEALLSQLNCTPVIARGRLLKRALRSGRNFRARYFKLYQDGSLVYYEKESASKPKGIMPLSPHFFVADSCLREYAFQLSDMRTTYYLASTDEEDKMYWMNLLAGVIREMEQFVTVRAVNAPPPPAPANASVKRRQHSSQAGKQGQAAAEKVLRDSLNILEHSASAKRLILMWEEQAADAAAADEAAAKDPVLAQDVESLVQIIGGNGPGSSIAFKDLAERYEEVADDLVATLILAKRRGRVSYDGGNGDMLWLGVHDDVIITVAS